MGNVAQQEKIMTIKQCKCKHEAQDQMHGKGMRVHTQSKDGVERCTVCGPGIRTDQRMKAHAQAWHPGCKK